MDDDNMNYTKECQWNRQDIPLSLGTDLNEIFKERHRKDYRKEIKKEYCITFAISCVLFLCIYFLYSAYLSGIVNRYNNKQPHSFLFILVFVPCIFLWGISLFFRIRGSFRLLMFSSASSFLAIISSLRYFSKELDVVFPETKQKIIGELSGTALFLAQYLGCIGDTSRDVWYIFTMLAIIPTFGYFLTFFIIIKYTQNIQFPV